MSEYTKFAGDLNARQIEFVKQGQDAVLKAVDAAIDNAPELPEGPAADVAKSVAAQSAEAAKQGHDAVFKAVDAIFENLPEVPSFEVPEQLAEAFKPVTDYFGSTEEFVAFNVETAKNWVAVSREFSEKIVAAFEKAAA